MKQVNAKRRARLRLLQFTGPFPGYDHSEAIKRMLCCVCGGCRVDEQTGEIANHAHHVIARPAGKWADMVPLCSKCHGNIHADGRFTFEFKHDINLALVASRLAEGAG